MTAICKRAFVKPEVGINQCILGGRVSTRTAHHLNLLAPVFRTSSKLTALRKVFDGLNHLIPLEMNAHHLTG